MLLRLIPSKTDIKFIRLRTPFMIMSVLMMVASIGLFGVKGLNLGIDFQGGTMIEIGTDGTTNSEEIRGIVNSLGFGNADVQELRGQDVLADSDNYLIVINEQSGGGDEREAEQAQQNVVETARAALNQRFAGITYSESDTDNGFALQLTRPAGFEIAKAQEYLDEYEITVARLSQVDDQTIRVNLASPYRFNENRGAEVYSAEEFSAEMQESLNAVYTTLTYRRQEVVGPKVSGELVQAGALAVTLAVMAVFVYIMFRFEWQFSMGAVFALVHDVVLTIGVFSLLNIEFNLSIIAAILTIVGYSLNDTVVVYDRVRENLRKYKRMPLAELLDQSINDTLSRTVMTSVTTLLALGALYIFGGEVIRGFTFAMIWGVIVGTYSSIFIASPVLLIFGVRRDWSKGGDTAPATTGA